MPKRNPTRRTAKSTSRASTGAGDHCQAVVHVGRHVVRLVGTAAAVRAARRQLAAGERSMGEGGVPGRRAGAEPEEPHDEADFEARLIAAFDAASGLGIEDPEREEALAAGADWQE